MDAFLVSGVTFHALQACTAVTALFDGQNVSNALESHMTSLVIIHVLWHTACMHFAVIQLVLDNTVHIPTACLSLR